MSTSAQKSANAANSRRSTGPITAEGKQKASQNSAKHYLTAKQIVAPGEDPQAFEDLRNDLIESWTPANTQEEILVDQIAQNTWRLMRIRRIEAATFEFFMPSLEQAAPPYPGASVKRAPSNHDESMVQAFHGNAKAFDNLRRYSTSIERAHHNAINELLKLQKQRKNSEIGSVSQKPEQPPNQSSAISAFSAFQDLPEIGSVSQKPEQPPNQSSAISAFSAFQDLPEIGSVSQKPGQPPNQSSADSAFQDPPVHHDSPKSAIVFLNEHERDTPGHLANPDPAQVLVISRGTD